MYSAGTLYFRWCVPVSIRSLARLSGSSMRDIHLSIVAITWNVHTCTLCSSMRDIHLSLIAINWNMQIMGLSMRDIHLSIVAIIYNMHRLCSSIRAMHVPIVAITWHVHTECSWARIMYLSIVAVICNMHLFVFPQNFKYEWNMFVSAWYKLADYCHILKHS